MGIPSYYRKLIRSCPRLIQKREQAQGQGQSQSQGQSQGQGQEPVSGVQWFFMDYNCLIYHCLHRPDAPVYPSEAETDSSKKIEWENQFIQTVVDYTLHVIRQVAPEQGVYLAIDGVVPMAKMRQQRLRRFKSAWLAARGYGRDGKAGTSEAGTSEANSGPRWDTNAITPGTAFMDRLADALRKRFIAEGKADVWRISSCREWGEGEHKIMAEWRRLFMNSTRSGKETRGALAIYGLDADLIVLSLLGREQTQWADGVWLFREVVEKGSTQYDMFGQEMYEWFSVDELRQWLVAPYAGSPTVERDFVYHYACMMSFLGNDFLPSSLSYKMRDDGHGILLQLLHSLFSNGQRMVGDEAEGYPLQWDGVRALFQALVTEEAGRVQESIWKKGRMARAMAVAAEERKEPIVVGDEDWPLAVMEEKVLLDHRGQLARNWEHRYMAHFFHGFPDCPTSRDTLCHQYLYGVQWVWAYYLGKTEDVCFEWNYPFSLPPLWSWLSAMKGLPDFIGTVQVRGSQIIPTEQLSLVLPITSWSLLPPCPQRALPYRAPHLFPAEFSFDSVGKRFFWECESMIPIPTIREVQAWCA